MTNYDFNENIPAAGNNPSNDQPVMQDNNLSIFGIWTNDHVGFRANNGGTHLQTNFAGFGSSSIIAGNPASVMYPGAGTANSAAAQLFYKNSQITTQLSAIRAWGFVDSTGTVISSQSVNVASIIHSGSGVFAITLAANSVTSANFAILSTCNRSAGSANLFVNYVITGAAQFTLIFIDPNAGTSVDPINFSFQVMQI